jgi:hypothetical protein
MNVHDKSFPVGEEVARRFRYEKVGPSEQPHKTHAYGRLAAHIAAPVLGSRMLFPARFDQAVDRLLKDPGAPGIRMESAAWYFGPVLHLEVNPRRLKQSLSDYVRDHRGVRWTGTSFLDASDWSAALRPLEDSPVHREMVELVAAEADYRDSRPYRRLLRRIRRGRPGERNGVQLSTEEDVEAYLRYCRALIKSARKHGVVRRHTSGTFRGRWLKHRGARPPLVDLAERDVGVAVGVDGELARHLGGKHRTAIAQALGMERIPVEVRLVHVGWLGKEMLRTGLAAHLALQAGLKRLAEEQTQ